MTSQIIPVEAFDYVVFGGTGDLAERKLIPALFRRHADGQIPANSRIIGAARGEMETSAYRDFAREALKTHVGEYELKDEAHINAFLDLLYYVSVDAKSDRGWSELKDLLGDQDKVRAFYLAVGPAIFGDIADNLHKHGMVRERSRLVIEKPIGKNLESAHELNEAVGRHFREDQIFRIDHYLGKETVQNLMALRFANTLYQPLWNATYIDHVQITVAEDLGVSPKEVTEMERRLSARDAIFDPAPGADDEHSFTPAAYLPSKNADPAELVEKADFHDDATTQIAAAMEDLDERSQDILRSLWLTEKKMTLHELADKYGVSAERIRQLEANAIKKLRKAIVT